MYVIRIIACLKRRWGADTIYRANTSISRLLLIYSAEMGVRSEGERNTELIRRLGGIRCDAPIVIEVF